MVDFDNLATTGDSEEEEEEGGGRTRVVLLNLAPMAAPGDPRRC